MKLMRPFLAIALLTTFLQVSAQERVKMGFELINYLNMPHAGGAQVDLFIIGASDRLDEVVRANSGLIKQSIPGLVNARVPISSVAALAADPAVERFEFSMAPPVLLNDSARIKSRINEIHSGLEPLPQAYQGEDVVVGIIDTGLDVTHPDFLDENGDTRVISYWDQNLPIGPLTPSQYGYGVVWDSTHINTGQMTTQDNNGHGTSVAGIAAGGGTANGMHKGMAPKADLIVVKYSGTNFLSKVADGVHFIFEQAEALGKPAVVNISLGRQTGSHDGLDAAALLIDAMLEESPGRVVVCAAGNFGEIPFWDQYHLRTQVTSDTSFTWFRYNPQINFGSGGIGGVSIEAWGDTAELQNVQFAIGADRVSPSYQYRGRTQFHNLAQNANTILTDTLFSTSGNELGVVHMLASSRGGQYQVQVWMVQPDSSTYNFRLISTGSGQFDVWAPRNAGVSRMLPYTFGEVASVPTIEQYPPIANYVFPDNNQHITDSWTCSPNVITVANYRNETGYIAYDGSLQQGTGIVEGEITASSSKGPTRDDRMKPDIAAPGDVVFSPYPLASLNILINTVDVIKIAPGGMHIRGGGTSATSPHVAGAVALYLQKCPKATYTEVRNALFTTAFGDEFATDLPNSTWGHGKLDAFAALNTSNIADLNLAVSGGDPFCEGEEVIVSAPSSFEEFEWSTGDSTSSITIDQSATVNVVAYNASHCKAQSDTITFTLLPTPEIPVITANGYELTSSEAFAYQWYFNGESIDGMDAMSIEAWATGDYQVAAINAEGCSALSVPVTVLITSINEIADGSIAIWPSPAREAINIRMTDPVPATFTIHDAGGRTVVTTRSSGGSTVVVPLVGLNAGTYVIRIEKVGGYEMYRFVKLP